MDLSANKTCSMTLNLVFALVLNWTTDRPSRAHVTQRKLMYVCMYK